MKSIRLWGLALLALALAVPGLGAPPSAKRRPAHAPASVPGAAQARARASTSISKGLAFLHSKQQANGSWEDYPAITALAMLAFLRAGVTEKDPAVARAAAFLVSQARPDGGIYSEARGPAQALPNYNTAAAMTALHATGNPRYRGTVRAAQKFLETSQYDEGEGFSPRDPQYGGIGYGSRADNPDLSNLQQSLEALKETDYPQNGPAFQRAIIFLQRCQNRQESNDQSWSGNDGGFVYAARGESKADEYTRQPHSSYGSMTYAGLKSYLYCGVTKTDPRARAAYNWIRAHYSVEENPRMRDDGLYYYYHTMSKTLAVYNDKVLTDSRGVKHYWAIDLIDAMARRQNSDGSWTNRNRRWQESDAELVTSYAVISLSNCLRGL
jgi:squalene-hopene/tetraprenyl-beta-curcumene cyclase